MIYSILYKDLNVINTMRSLLLSFLACSSALDPNPCITCKHFIKTRHSTYSKCKKFPIIIDIMHEVNYGYIKHEYIDYNFCSSARTFGFMCGENGKHYEKIELSTSDVR